MNFNIFRRKSANLRQKLLLPDLKSTSLCHGKREIHAFYGFCCISKAKLMEFSEQKLFAGVHRRPFWLILQKFFSELKRPYVQMDGQLI
jgi:hypothetical protein